MIRRTPVAKGASALLLATGAVVAAWNVGWLSYGSAKSLEAPAAEQAAASQHDLPAFRGAGAVGPAVSELPLNNVAAADAGDSHVIPSAWLAGMVEQASASTRPLLQDGVVTLDERNSALLAAQQCTVDGTANLAGVVTKDLAQFPGPFATFGGATAPTHELLLQWSAVHQACVVEHFRDVASAWSAAAEYARIVPRWAAIAACMREAGASVGEGADFQELLAQSVKFSGSRGLYDSCNARLP